MKWREVVIETLSEEGGLPEEVVTAMLMERGVSGVWFEDAYETKLFIENSCECWDYAEPELLEAIRGKAYLRFYLPEEGPELEEVAEGVRELLAGELAPALGSLALSVRIVDDEGWAENWKRYYKPLKLGKRVVVRPEWEPYEPCGDDVVVTLNPGQLFGTGLHQTTKMCVEAIEQYAKPGMDVLDLGCGSGILAISALLLSDGSRAVAVDIDRAALKTVPENAGLNGVEGRLRVFVGNAVNDERLAGEIFGEYDLITANIVADVVMAYTPLVKGMLRSGGVFVMSGIIKDRLRDVSDCLAQNGFKVIETRVMDEWASVAASL